MINSNSAKIINVCLYLMIAHLFILFIHPAFAEQNLGEECNATNLCNEKKFLTCNVSEICVCQTDYVEDTENKICLAQLGDKCLVDANLPGVNTCVHPLLQCWKDLEEIPTCICVRGYTESAKRCLAPLNATCYEENSCLDEHAVCVSLPPEITTTAIPTTTTTLVNSALLNRAPISFTGNRAVIRPDMLLPSDFHKLNSVLLYNTGYQGSIHRENKFDILTSFIENIENGHCICDEGYEMDEENNYTSCIKSGCDIIHGSSMARLAVITALLLTIYNIRSPL